MTLKELPKEVTQAIAAEFREHLTLLREEDERREKFGIYGDGAFAALSEISNILRNLTKYGGHENLKTDDDGKVDIHTLRDIISDVIRDECPCFDEVWV